MVARVFAKHYEAEERLASLGLKSGVLQEAARAGKLARSTNTPFHPKWYAGNVMYSNALATMGELLSGAKDGWVREDPSGHPLVVNHRRKIALAVASSDANTGNGNVQEPPSTRPAKGIRTEEAVDENEWLLFPDMFTGDHNRHELAGYEFWWLLMHPNDKVNELRLELSRGIRLNKERSIANWSERIMLISQPLDEGSIPIVGQPDGDGPVSGEYDVDVRKLN